MDSVDFDNWMVGYSDSQGYGYGDGEEDGEGNRDGKGKGKGSGEGEGNSNGKGFGSGKTSGTGACEVSDYFSSLCVGFGDGSGFCADISNYCYDGYDHADGCGCTDGSGHGSVDDRDYNFVLRKYKGKKVYYIDGIPCFLRHVRNEFACVEVINKDMRTSPMVIGKGDGFFAHGATLREAANELERKRFSSIEFEAKKQFFLETFNSKDKYPAKAFFHWHGILTGSCIFGRKRFVAERGIDLEKDKMTRKQFFEKVKGQYGWERIAELANSE